MNDAGADPRLPLPFAEEARSGLLGWLTTVDHKKIGILYIVTSFFFFAVAGIEAMVMRWQLAAPDRHSVSPEAFNQLFTMHGLTMILFAIMPIGLGMGIYLVPLMIGARDMAFPRLNALGYWLFLFGGLLLYFGFLAGGAPDVGWFAYSPLNERAFTRGPGVLYWILGPFLSGVGSITTGINLIATVLTMRTKGMQLWKVPLFVWIIFIDAVLIIFALPALSASQVMLFLDRVFDAHFFDPEYNGSALLWQHVFWFFGHPEVYIMVLPAFGAISEVVPVFSRKVIFGYAFVAGSTAAIGFLSFGVWAHHMFAVGMGTALDGFFAGMSYLIAIPTGIKIFNWIATMWRGELWMTTPMYYAVAFLLQFVVGGLSGIMVATVPIDWQVTDSYFVVAHFHYVLFGGALFGLFAGLHYWFPKMSGRMLSERLGKAGFWLLFVGFNLTFFPMHIAGLLGMPRRVYTYPAHLGWDGYNLASSIGAFVVLAGMLAVLVNVVWALRWGRSAGADPWDAWTLEWSVPSPPPEYDFVVRPEVQSRRPLWDIKHPDDPDAIFE